MRGLSGDGRWGLPALVALGALILAVAVAVPTDRARAQGGTASSPDAFAAIATMTNGPPGLGRCGAVLNASEDRRRALATRLVRALGQAGHPVGAGDAAGAMVAACQLAPPGAAVAPVLARLAGHRRPRTRVCRALRRDRHDVMRASSGPLASMRRASALFEDGRRPGLEAVHARVTGSGARARALNGTLSTLPMRTADGRRLRHEMRLLAADWANHARAYGGGTPDAATMVRGVGAAEAVERLRRWLDGARSVRERAQRIEREANRASGGTSPDCPTTRIFLLD